MPGGSDAAAASSSSTSSTGQVVVIGTDSYIVNTTVDDTDIGQVAEGDQATVTPTGATTVDYGTVASIGLIATETSDVATFPVVIDVTGRPDRPLRRFDGRRLDHRQAAQRRRRGADGRHHVHHSGQATVTEVKNGKHVSCRT